MRTAVINLDGKPRLLSFSARVVRSCIERYGALEGINTALSDPNPVKVLEESVWIISRMMDAGERYAKHMGLENPAALNTETLLDLVDINDLFLLRAKIGETLQSGQRTTIEVNSPKNAEATQGE